MTLTDNITDICDRLIDTRNPKAIAQGLKALPDQSKAAFASMYIATELSLTDAGYRLLGRIQVELLKEE